MGVVNKAFDSVGNIAGDLGKGVEGVIGAGQKGYDQLGGKQVQDQLSTYVSDYGPMATLATIAAITGGAGAAAFGGGAAGGAAAGEGAGVSGAGSSATAAGGDAALDSAALADQSTLAQQGLEGAGELSNVPATSGYQFSTPVTTSSQVPGTENGMPFGQGTGSTTIKDIPATLGPSGAGALGINNTPTLQTNQPGAAQPGTTPAAGQPGGAAVQPAQTPATAPQGGAGTTQAGSQQSAVDKILQAMKNNPLQTASAGLLAAPLLAGKPKTPQSTQTQNQLGEQAAQTAQQLLQQFQSGTLSAGQQAQLDQVTQQTKNQINQYFASIGQSDSTSAKQALAQVDQQSLQMKQQMLDNALNQGLQAIGVSGGQLSQVSQAVLGQDQALRQAFGNFAQGIGNIAGRGGVTINTTPTQPTGTVQSGGTPQQPQAQQPQAQQ